MTFAAIFGVCVTTVTRAPSHMQRIVDCVRVHVCVCVCPSHMRCVSRSTYWTMDTRKFFLFVLNPTSTVRSGSHNFVMTCRLYVCLCTSPLQSIACGRSIAKIAKITQYCSVGHSSRQLMCEVWSVVWLCKVTTQFVDLVGHSILFLKQKKKKQ